jgi:hypothetical protein
VSALPGRRVLPGEMDASKKGMLGMSLVVSE